MVTLSAILQAPVQALLSPSMWVPCFRRLHSYKERWQTEASQVEFRAAVVAAIKKVMEMEDNTEFLDIHKISDTFIRIFAFTRAEWLDVVEITYKNGVYEVYSFSSGLVPLIVPFACVFNVALFFAPFLDNKFNKVRVQRLRQALTVNVQVSEK